MAKYLNAILWKEFKSIKDTFISKLIPQIGMSIILTIMFVVKIKLLNTNINATTAKNFLMYMLIVVGYISFISNLKFWQEKSFKTIESLLATPIPIKLIILGKVLAPTIISIIIILIHYILYSIGFYIFLKINTFSFSVFLIPILFSITFCFCYGFINGYCMWCGSISMAKILQFFSIAIYLTSIFSILTINSNTEILNSKIKYVFILLIILGFYSLLFTSKEKAITTIQD